MSDDDEKTPSERRAAPRFRLPMSQSTDSLAAEVFELRAKLRERDYRIALLVRILERIEELVTVPVTARDVEWYAGRFSLVGSETFAALSMPRVAP